MPLTAIPDLEQRKTIPGTLNSTEDRGIVWFHFSNIGPDFVLAGSFVSRWLTVVR
jgi:hypothetical protein